MGDDRLKTFIDWLVQRVESELETSVAQDEMAMKRIEAAAVSSLQDLMSESETKIDLPFLIADAQGPKHFNMTLSKEDLESIQICAPKWQV